MKRAAHTIIVRVHDERKREKRREKGRKRLREEESEEKRQLTLFLNGTEMR